MRLIAKLVAIVVFFVGLFVVPRLFSSNYSHFAEQQMPLIKATIENDYARFDPACIRGESYPVENGETNPGPFAGGDNAYQRRHCTRCEDLKATGLLVRRPGVDENAATTRSSTSKYALTPLGEEVYSEEIRPSDADPTRRYLTWQFCFGKTRVQSIDKAAEPFGLGGNKYVRLTYTAYVENPHALLFEPTATVLNLPIPTKKSPALLAPIETTVEFFRNGEAGLRPDVQ